MDPPADPDDARAEAARVQAVVGRVLGGRVEGFTVLARDGGLVLRGRAASYYLKQLAQEKAFAACGKRVAGNEIEVVRGGGGGPPDGRPTPRPHGGSAVPTLRELVAKLLANGKVDTADLITLQGVVYLDGQVSRFEAECLIELHRRLDLVAPAFERFVYQAIKRHLMADGVIDPEEAAWLRRVIYADGRVEERERKLVRELNGEATATCPEFDALLADCQP
jgi:osmotically-inducible protein OsmY